LSFDVPQAVSVLPSAGNLKDVQVLVVDDNHTNRLVLNEVLTRWGMKPTLVESGPAALAAVETAVRNGTSYRIILLDAGMPDMDGFQTTVKLRSNPNCSSTVIMMLCSAAPQQDAERCLAIEITLYMVKPLKIRSLLEILQSVIAADSPTASPAPAESLVKTEDTLAPLPLRILLAEDNPVNQQLAVRLLQKMGHTVAMTGNGKEALEALEKNSYDIVLMDVQMPEMDGFAATAAIREQERSTGNHLPIIAMTARAMKGDRERCLEAGMDDYISKPVHRKELGEVIARNLPRKATLVASVADRANAATGN
jgi:CheY-like chemotaxis protein